MYKAVLVHEIVPGKFSAFERWFRDVDRARKAKDPAYTPPRRYLTIIGSLTRVCIEYDWETIPDHPIVWSKVIEQQGDMKDIIVPGKSEAYVLKELGGEE